MMVNDRDRREECLSTEVVEACPLCRSRAGELVYATCDRQHRLPGEFMLVRCGECGLVRLSPRPTPEHLPRYYPSEEYYSYQLPTEVAAPVGWRHHLAGLRDRIRHTVLASLGYPTPAPAWWQRALRPVLLSAFRKPALYHYPEGFPRFRPGGWALDVGCGNGVFLSHLKRHGWNVVGVDLGRAAAEAAGRAFGIQVHVGALEEAPLAPASFDFIHLRHLLEHLPDPVATLAAVHRLLKPGGLLYIETPNVDSYGCRVCGPYWHPWESPRHLCLFSPDTLHRLLAGAGLRPTRLWTRPWSAVYLWDAAYRLEERAGTMLPRRPYLGARVRVQASRRALQATLRHRFRPLEGDLLYCWATKPEAE